MEKTGKLQMGGATLVAQLVKNPPVMRETPVLFLGQEDPLDDYSLLTDSCLLSSMFIASRGT